jgi:monoamine oxidase
VDDDVATLKVGTYTSASESHRATLQESVADRRIYFAGEGTHTTHPSTVVGALHEGERAAQAVHAANGEPGNPPELRR